MQSPSEFVLASTVRTGIVRHLSEDTATTDELLTAIDASTSAIYDALSTLRRRGVLDEGDAVWTLTAQGQLVADNIDAWQSTEEFLAVDPDFWRNHRIDVLPAAFRRRLPEIGAYEVVRDSPGDPNRHEEVAISHMESADYCDITTPFYSKRHQEAVPNHPRTRLLVTREATDISIQRFKHGRRERLKQPENHVVRLTECRFASIVTDDALVFGLPTNTGDDSLAETTATLVSETASAVQWGTELFESLWTDADPMDRYIEREYPELLE